MYADSKFNIQKKAGNQCHVLLIILTVMQSIKIEYNNRSLAVTTLNYANLVIFLFKHTLLNQINVGKI